ncbi:3-isopropylmalate dehydratase [Pyrolobus fumarii 1A]|uniref:3-isopropylmalate dehydratase large subunit n=1 Tax=Pyrolobus fumarii (strain DSM 11204 / 1A) TaxID=694429 RepID=G0ED61_PYRF1|nr:3-isopropylmalate dehydratase large subunit [Pyrolobus fumarii]AEM39739.1 3-isopropylmalate dehydratase [Pyrolobus fumarii 1A]
MAGQTFVEKLFSLRTGRRVSPGEIVVVDVDVVYAQDGTAPLAIRVMREEFGVERVAKPDRTLFFIDHVSPSSNPDTSALHRLMREFAARHGIRLYDVGMGISHQVVFEEGWVVPGAVVVGADSHTVTGGAVGAFATGVGSTDAAAAMVSGRLWFRVPEAIRVWLRGSLSGPVLGKDVALKLLSILGSSGASYKSLEFWGDGVKSLSLASRLTIANMSVEMGAKNAYFPPDERVFEHLRNVGAKVPVRPIYPDPDAVYSDEIEVELDKVEPMVALPPNPSNAKPVTEVEGLEVDQVFIGSCTNGREEDFEAAARVLKGRKVHPRVRCIAVPASRRVYMNLLKRGIIDILVEAGCIVTHSTCGPCVGAHFGLLGPEEVGVFTTNRNFPGRAGHRSAKIILASPYTAAAAAVTGKLVDPRSLIRG